MPAYIKGPLIWINRRTVGNIELVTPNQAPDRRITGSRRGARGREHSEEARK